MIRSCKDRETERLWRRWPSRKFKNIERSARVKLGLLDAATSLKDLSLPGLRLEKLGGIAPDSTAFASTTSSGSASGGGAETRRRGDHGLSLKGAA